MKAIHKKYEIRYFMVPHNNTGFNSKGSKNMVTKIAKNHRC